MTQELLGRVHRELLDVLNSINQDKIHHDGDDFHELLNDVEKALAAQAMRETQRLEHMTQEALKLALEALEYWDVQGKLHQPTEEAITAIKEALAQEQEPVAWAHYDTFKNLDSLATARFKATLATKNTGACCIALYTAPPQRTWVGLTIEEIAACCRESTTTQLSFYNAIEARLKELNA